MAGGSVAAVPPFYGASAPVIHNVVATANLQCKLVLREIAMKVRNTEYNPRRFSAVVMRIREPKATALVFGSGKIVVAGTHSEEDARLAARKVARVIKKVGNDARFTEFTVQNLVATFHVPYPIHLEQLQRKAPATSHVSSTARTHNTRAVGCVCHVLMFVFVCALCLCGGVRVLGRVVRARSVSWADL